MDNDLSFLVKAIIDATQARSEAQAKAKQMRDAAQAELNKNGLDLKVNASDVNKGLKAVGKSIQDEQKKNNQILRETNLQANREELELLRQSNRTKLADIKNAGNEQRAVNKTQSQQRIADIKQAFNEQNVIQKNAEKISLENIRQQGRLELEAVKSANRQKLVEAQETNKRALAMYKQQNTVMGKLNVDNVMSQMEAYKTNNSKAFGINSSFSSQYDEIYNGLKNGTLLSDEASKKFDTLKNRIDAAGKSGKTFGGIMADELKSFARWQIASTLIMTPIKAMRDAIKVMKEVDSELVNIQKVTNATAEEMKNLTKEAYAMATAYGRSPVEFLKSVTEFSRAGYGDISSELGKLSLLTQNVGDVEEELADKFLISADAAWKYGGNIESLRAILDGFNELSNKTATTVDNLADGITVAGSVFAQAGLTAQDYAGIVGTATAKTQRDGNEMARAWRTILMNIRQIQGTDLETGEIIDSDSLANAEKTLNGIGISIREVVNGSNELRNPMTILNELADKWKDLNSVQQSAIQEALAGRLLPGRIEMCA